MTRRIFRSCQLSFVKWHGMVRTGMMVTVYEMEYEGKGNQQVLRELPTFGYGFDELERKLVRDFILDYAPRAQRARPGP